MKHFAIHCNGLFSVRNVEKNGEMDLGAFSSLYLCYIHHEGGPYSYDRTAGLRPVFKLKDTVKVTGGSGSSVDPYTLGT